MSQIAIHSGNNREIIAFRVRVGFIRRIKRVEFIAAPVTVPAIDSARKYSRAFIRVR